MAVRNRTAPTELSGSMLVVLIYIECSDSSALKSRKIWSPELSLELPQPYLEIETSNVYKDSLPWLK